MDDIVTVSKYSKGEMYLGIASIDLISCDIRYRGNIRDCMPAVICSYRIALALSPTLLTSRDDCLRGTNRNAQRALRQSCSSSVRLA